MAIKMIEPEETVYLHALSGGEVIENYSVFDRINIHNILTVREA